MIAYDTLFASVHEVTRRATSARGKLPTSSVILAGERHDKHHHRNVFVLSLSTLFSLHPPPRHTTSLRLPS